MSRKPKILAFAGSIREGSYNKKVIKAAIKGAKDAGAEVTFIDLKDYPLPIYDGDIEESQGLPENAMKLKKLMWENDGFIIASPEYNSSISGALKNLIDWTTRQATKDEVYLSCFIDKIAAIISASPGGLGGIRGLVHLRSILENINTWVLPAQKSISNASEAFDNEGNLNNKEHQKEIENIGKKLTETISKLKS